jgi:hypothetical protein
MNHVDVIELLENGNFTNGCGGNALLLTFEPYFFEGKDFVGLLIWIRKEIPLAMYTTPYVPSPSLSIF